jgi:hypothetical protein
MVTSGRTEAAPRGIRSRTDMRCGVRPDAPQCQSTASGWAGMSHGEM